MPLARISSIEIVRPKSSDRSEIKVTLEDGGCSRFLAATPDEPGRWTAGERDFSFGPSVLFVDRLEQDSVSRAAARMAEDMGGYWLRYYNNRRAKKKTKPVPVASVALTERTSGACAVAQVSLADGRQFSILTATPVWFEKKIAELGLPFYYGASVLFVRSLELAVVRKAVGEMAKEGDILFCLYDTPRTTLPDVLAGFKARHL